MSNTTNPAANKKIGAMLQFARETRRKTQQDITDAGGGTKNHISAIERGISKASIELLQIYCKVLDMTSNEILQVPDIAVKSINPELFGVIADMDESQQAKILEIIRVMAK